MSKYFLFLLAICAFFGASQLRAELKTTADPNQYSYQVHEIDQVKLYYRAGNILSVVTFEDGSRWLIREKSSLEFWRAGDSATVWQNGRDFYMTNHKTGGHCLILTYAIYSYSILPEYPDFELGWPPYGPF